MMVPVFHKGVAAKQQLHRLPALAHKITSRLPPGVACQLNFNEHFQAAPRTSARPRAYRENENEDDD
jgi:hypothetical protein